MDGLQETESFETFTEIFQALICDFVTSVSKLINLSSKGHLPLKVEIDGFYRTESFEALTKSFYIFITQNIPYIRIRYIILSLSPLNIHFSPASILKWNQWYVENL